jgi:hypothetical protein
MHKKQAEIPFPRLGCGTFVIHQGFVSRPSCVPEKVSVNQKMIFLYKKDLNK